MTDGKPIGKITDGKPIYWTPDWFIGYETDWFRGYEVAWGVNYTLEIEMG